MPEHHEPAKISQEILSLKGEAVRPLSFEKAHIEKGLRGLEDVAVCFKVSQRFHNQPSRPENGLAGARRITDAVRDLEAKMEAFETQ